MIKWFAVGVTVIASVIGGLGSIYLKKGSEDFNHNPFQQLKNAKLLIGLSLYAASVILFLSVLSLVDLSMLYPVTSLSYVWMSLFSMKLLGEEMNKFKWAGILLIITGVALVTM